MVQTFGLENWIVPLGFYTIGVIGLSLWASIDVCKYVRVCITITAFQLINCKKGKIKIVTSPTNLS